jgi:hypothetical protein
MVSVGAGMIRKGRHQHDQRGQAQDLPLQCLIDYRRGMGPIWLSMPNIVVRLSDPGCGCADCEPRVNTGVNPYKYSLVGAVLVAALSD